MEFTNAKLESVKIDNCEKCFNETTPLQSFKHKGSVICEKCLRADISPQLNDNKPIIVIDNTEHNKTLNSFIPTQENTTEHKPTRADIKYYGVRGYRG